MNRILLMIVILILVNASAFIYILVADTIMMVTNPADWQNGTVRLGVTSGRLLLISQSSITDSINELKEAEDINPNYRYFLNSRIMGGLAFTFLLLFIALGGLKKIIRSQSTSFQSWLLIIFLAFTLVGGLQVLASYYITSDVVYPFEGLLHLIINLDVFAESVSQTLPIQNISAVGMPDRI